MARSNNTFRLAAALMLAVLVSGCTLKKQETPSLTGPSELGTSVRLSASPDVLSLDGASQSVVTIQVSDNNGQPLRNLSLRAEIEFNGTLVDFGTLSARNVTTDGNGHAAVVYTAPMSGTNVDTGATVQIVVTPAGTDFANATARFVSIRLVPVGVVVPPDGLTPKFTMNPTSATDHQAVLFDGSTSTSNPTNPITSYTWDYGDGHHGSGRTDTHSFDDPGTFLVTMTIADAFGRSASATQTIVITPGGAGLTANIVFSPTPVVFGQQTFFNASASKAGPGHSIARYDWNFGDGATGSGVTTSHTFTTPGTYTVLLTVTDDAGHTETATATVTVQNDSPTAAFTFTPTAPTVTPPATTVSVSFDGSTSSAVNGRTITTYSWSFSNGGTASGSGVSHSFGTGTFSVTLTVTDSAGKTSSTTKTFTVS
jgi:PKD repeat protein